MSGRGRKSGNPAKRAEAASAKDVATIQRLRNELAEARDELDACKDIIWSGMVAIASTFVMGDEQLADLRGAYRGAEQKELGDRLSLDTRGRLVVNGRPANTDELYLRRGRCIGLAVSILETACSGEPEIATWFESGESSLDAFLLDLAADRMNSGNGYAAA